MKNLISSLTGKELKVKCNKVNKTFTIITDMGSYTTLELSKEDFKKCKFYTVKDWINYFNEGKTMYEKIKGY